MTKLLKLREARTILNVHKNTLTSYIKSRKIAVVVMPGGQKRITEAELNRFVESRTFGVSEHHG